MTRARIQSYGDGTYLIELGGTGAYALRAPRGAIVSVPLAPSKASPGALALAAVGGALTPMFGRPPIPADVAEMYRRSAERVPTVDVQTSEGGGVGPFVLDLRPFFADGKGVYQGPAGPAPSSLMKGFQSYQTRVGAGNAAPPPLAPR